MWLDFLRGVAAVLVLGEHWRNIFFVDYPQIAKHRALWAPLYLLTAAGHQAVIIFFVLSGFLISGSIFRMQKRGAWSTSVYAVHRLVRLWVVLIPGLLLCAACDGLGLWLNRAPRLYRGLEVTHQTPNVVATLTWPNFFGNLFFLQGIRVPMLGSNGSLWSLSYEFWFYVLFPLALFTLLRGRLLVRLLCCISFVLCAWFLGSHVLLAFPVWLMGAFLVGLPLKQLGKSVCLIVGGVFLCLIFSAARAPFLAGWPADLIVGCGTTLFVWVLLADQAKADPVSTGVRTSRALARFSYTLYVVHTPVLVLLASLAVGDGRWQPNGVHLLLAIGPLLLAVLLSYGVASVTEFRTEQVRTAVQRLLPYSSAN